MVGTKKDQFIDMHFGRAYRRFDNNIPALNKHCEEELSKQMTLIEQELSDIPHGRFDAIVAVSKGKSKTYTPGCNGSVFSVQMIQSLFKLLLKRRPVVSITKRFV